MRKLFLAGSIMLWIAVWNGYLTAELPGPSRRIEVLLSLLLLPDATIQSWAFADFDYVGIFDRWTIWLVAALMIASGHVLGLACLQFVRWRQLTRLEQHVFGGAMGLHLVSTASFLLAWSCGLEWAPWLWAPLAAGTCWAGWRLWRHPLANEALAAESEGPAAEKAASLSWPPWPVWIAIALLIWTLLCATAPPTDFDVREYHLQTPKEWFQNGRIAFLPHNVYSNMPLAAEAPSLIAMSLWPGADAWWYGAIAGKVWMAWFTVLTTAGLWAAASRWLSREAACWSVILYATSPWVFHVSTSGLNEGVLAAYLFLALYATHLACSPATTCDLALPLSGWLTGAAMACKYTAAPYLAAPLAAWLAATQLRRRPRQCAAWLVLCLAAGGAWNVKNAVQTGNPIFPLATRWLGGGGWSPDQQQRWDNAHRPPQDASGAAYGFQQAFKAAANVAWRHAWSSPATYPLLAVAVVLTLLPGNAPPPLVAMRWYLAWMVWMVGVWFLATHRLERFLAPALPLAILTGSAAITAWENLEWRIVQRTMAGLAVAVSLLWILSPLMSRGALASLQAHREDPEHVRLHPAWVFLNENTEPDECSLLVGEAQVFDFEHRVLYATCFDESPLQRLLALHRRPLDLWRALREQNVKFVFVNWSEIARYRSPDNYGFDAFIQPQLMQRLQQDGVLQPVIVPGTEPTRAQVWRVSETPPAAPPG